MIKKNVLNVIMILTITNGVIIGKNLNEIINPNTKMLALAMHELAYDCTSLENLEVRVNHIIAMSKSLPLKEKSEALYSTNDNNQTSQEIAHDNTRGFWHYSLTCEEVEKFYLKLQEKIRKNVID